MSGRLIGGISGRNRGEFGNRYEITSPSFVYKDGLPVIRKVWLFYRKTGKLIAETWSAADGSYFFRNIPYYYQGYFIVAFDYGEPIRNAAIADLVTPSLMDS